MATEIQFGDEANAGLDLVDRTLNGEIFVIRGVQKRNEQSVPQRFERVRTRPFCQKHAGTLARGRVDRPEESKL